MSASPVAESGPWSLGTLIGFPVAVMCTLVLIVVGVLAYKRLGTFYRFEAHLIGGGALAIAFVLAVATASPLGMWPYESEFHQWRDVSGTVQRVESRQIVTEGGMSERFVFIIDGQPFSVDDTRAAVTDEGDWVELACKREWEYAARAGWACRWAGDQP